jgi:hypothetical protein
VYLLFGIYGVFIPLNYGEGKGYAFQRLHDEIDRVHKGRLLVTQLLNIWRGLQSVVSKHTEILQWLSPEPYLQHHKQMKKDILPGTGAWFLADPIFEKWKYDSGSSILWLHGIPGSGKSKLV